MRTINHMRGSISIIVEVDGDALIGDGNAKRPLRQCWRRARCRGADCSRGRREAVPFNSRLYQRAQTILASQLGSFRLQHRASQSLFVNGNCGSPFLGALTAAGRRRSKADVYCQWRVQLGECGQTRLRWKRAHCVWRCRHDGRHMNIWVLI